MTAPQILTAPAVLVCWYRCPVCGMLTPASAAGIAMQKPCEHFIAAPKIGIPQTLATFTEGQ